MEQDEKSLEEKVMVLERVCAEQQEIMNAISNELRSTKQRLDAVLPVYEAMYRKWLLRLFMPWDAELEGKRLMRCNCGEYFLLDGEREFTRHQGHMYRGAKTYGWFTQLRLRLGGIK